MTWAKPCLILVAIAWAILLFGATLFGASTLVHAQDPSIVVPGIAWMTHWKYLGQSIPLLIFVAVPFGIFLGFVSATKLEPVTITNKVPEVFQVTSHVHVQVINQREVSEQGTGGVSSDFTA